MEALALRDLTFIRDENLTNQYSLTWGSQLSLFYNDAYIALLGEKHPTSFGQPLQVVWPEVWTDIEPMVAQVLAGNTVHHDNVLLAIERRKGQTEEVWFSLSWVTAHDVHGCIQGFFGSLTDMTANAMPQIVWSTLPDGFADYYNQQWYDFTGVMKGSADGEGWNNIFHPDDRTGARTNSWPCFRTNYATRVGRRRGAG